MNTEKIDLTTMGFEDIDHAPLIATGKPYKIYAQLLDKFAQKQFADVLNYAPVTYAALMPDAHSGYTMPIGGVCAVKDVVVPQFVGFDIGCGMCAYRTVFTKTQVHKFADEIYAGIRAAVPVGFKTHATAQQVAVDLPCTPLTQYILDTIGVFQLGTLGSGNHFIEIGYGRDDAVWIVVHSGSRGMGHKIASHYMTQAYIEQNPHLNDMDAQIAAYSEKYANVKQYNPAVFERNLELFKQKSTLEMQQRAIKVDSDKMHGIFGLDIHSELGKNYIMDQNFALAFALENRKHMIHAIVGVLNTVIGVHDAFEYSDETRFINRNHNHAELDNTSGLWIHRKGATHAEKGMRGVIPGNMRDGSFVVIGKGCADSLCSSSHGAGRVMSRMRAKNTVLMKDFERSMQGITGTVDENTIDESPFAYKNIFEVMDLQTDLVDVVEHIQVLINIKDNTPSFGSRAKNS